jgi:hypothetical protein
VLSAGVGSIGWPVPAPTAHARIINNMLIVIALFSNSFIKGFCTKVFPKDFSPKGAKRCRVSKGFSLRLCGRDLLGLLKYASESTGSYHLKQSEDPLLTVFVRSTDRFCTPSTRLIDSSVIMHMTQEFSLSIPNHVYPCMKRRKESLK